MLLEHELWLYASRNEAAREHFAARFAEARRRVVESTASWPDDGRSDLPGTPDQVASLLVALLVGLEMQHRVDPERRQRRDRRPRAPSRHRPPRRDRPTRPHHRHHGRARPPRHDHAPHHLTAPPQARHHNGRHRPPHVPHEENVVNIDDIDLLAETWGRRRAPRGVRPAPRPRHPVHWHPSSPTTRVLGRHPPRRRASRSAATTRPSRPSSARTFMSTHDDEALAQIRMTMLNMDPPKHHRYRRLVSKGFTPADDRPARSSDIVERAAAIMDEVCERASASSWRRSPPSCRCR